MSEQRMTPESNSSVAQSRSSKRRPVMVVSLGIAALIVACSPGAEGTGESSAAFPLRSTLAATATAVPETPTLFNGRAAALEGDESFSVESLSEEARERYEALWASIRDEEQRRYFEALAKSDNLYEYSRLVNTYLVSLLTAMRVTGDLQFLDEVDRLAELMRAELDDSWRGGSNESEGRDGYLNWVWRNSTSSEHLGKDLHETDEMGTHALIAELAWAYEQNRGKASPAGIDFGERADFWLEYLEEHFEPKWRERKEIDWPRFPFLSRPHMHETVSFIKYHYYMYRLTGKDPYLQEAMRLSDLVYAEFREATTPTGPAFVWARSVISMGGSERYLMPTTYSSLIVADTLDLHWEGFYGWADASVPERLARTISEFVLDNGATDFARDVGGGQDRAGLPASSSREWHRMTPPQYALKPFALLAAWDESGRIRDISAEVYDELPARHRYLHIPLGLLIDSLSRSEEPTDR